MQNKFDGVNLTNRCPKCGFPVIRGSTPYQIISGKYYHLWCVPKESNNDHRITYPGTTPEYCGITDPSQSCEGCVQRIPFTEVNAMLDSLKGGDLIEAVYKVKEHFHLTNEQLWLAFREWH